MSAPGAPAPAFTVHPSAIVDPGAQIGAGSRVWHFVHVCGGARIGERCSLGQNVFVGNRVTIGNNVKIQNNVSVYDNVMLEDDVFCGPSMVFTNVYNPRSAVTRKDEYRDTVVRRGATLGANCTVVCGVTVGEHAFVAAGASVEDRGDRRRLVRREARGPRGKRRVRRHAAFRRAPAVPFALGGRARHPRAPATEHEERRAAGPVRGKRRLEAVARVPRRPPAPPRPPAPREPTRDAR